MTVETFYYDLTKKLKKSIVYSDENGLYHRTDGPARSWYRREDGSLGSEEYITHGLRNRIEGPALIRYKRDRSVESEHYFINGVDLTKEEWEIRTDVIAVLIAKKLGGL